MSWGSSIFVGILTAIAGAVAVRANRPGFRSIVRVLLEWRWCHGKLAVARECCGA